MIEVSVVGIGITSSGSAPLLLLKERDGDRVLPIGIGLLEAQAIALPLQGVRPPRPMTHDVFVNMIANFGGHLRRVELTDLADNTFVARLLFDHSEREQELDIRPSDAVALAVRTETPIYVAEAVLDQAGVVLEHGSEMADSASQAASSEHVDVSKLSVFKEFIETLDLGDLEPRRDN